MRISVNELLEYGPPTSTEQPACLSCGGSIPHRRRQPYCSESCPIALTQQDDGPNGIAHIAEAPRLCPVAVHGDGFICQSLPHEARDNHAILPRLVRADDIEEAHDGHSSLELGVVSESEELIDGLR